MGRECLGQLGLAGTAEVVEQPRLRSESGPLDDLHEGRAEVDVHPATGALTGFSHRLVHDFDVGLDRYGIPSMIDMEEMPECKDSTRTRLSSLLPEDGKLFTFKYTYDLGDNWEHEVCSRVW